MTKTLLFKYVPATGEISKEEFTIGQYPDVTVEKELEILFEAAIQYNVILAAVVSNNKEVALKWSSLVEEMVKVLNKAETEHQKAVASVTEKAFRKAAQYVVEAKLDKEGYIIPASVIQFAQVDELKTSVFNSIKEELVNMKEEEVKVDEIHQEEVTKVEETVKEMIEGFSTDILKEVFMGDSDEAYNRLVEATERIISFLENKYGECTVTIAMRKALAERKAKINEFLEKHGKTEKALKVLNTVVKKVIAVALGIITFVAEATLILAAMVCRVAIHAAEEGVGAGKAIGKSFNKNIIGLFRKK